MPRNTGPKARSRSLQRVALTPEALHRAIRHAGLEQSLGLVEAATPEQLAALLDVDLWSAPLPGHREELAEERFGEWLEVLVDHGAAAAARVVERLDPRLVGAGLSRYVRVIDPGVLIPTEASDDEPLETGLFESSGSTADLGGYIVHARREDAWDAVVGLLVELSTGQPACFHAILEECRRLSNDGRERDGLDGLLDAPDQLLHDLAVERDDRRAERGFSGWSDARAFLAAARERRPDGRREKPVPTAEPRPARGARRPARRGLVPAAGRDRDPGALQALMEYLAEHHSAAYLARGQELAFLANTLVAACELQASPFTPAQAVRAALATCNLGLQRQPAPPGLDYLVDRGLVTLFEDGWAALHREVSLFVAEGLLAALSTLRAGDSETLDGLHALHRSLGAHLAAGTPWLARDDLEVLAILDMPTWSGLCGLLSECPVITDAVTAVVERRSGRIDPEAFAFIGTNAQIELVRAFVARLPRQLAA